MISLALKKHKHPNINYKKMDWLDIEELERKFDSVMCRGNSLSYVEGWDKQQIDSKEAKRKINESIALFFKMTNKNGLIYVDTVSQEELDKNGGDVEILDKNIHLKGKIEYDWNNKIRKTFGEGKLRGEEFTGGAISYLLTPHELEGIIKKYNPSVIWTPKLRQEKNYHVICARR